MGLILVALAACAHRPPEPFVKDELVQVTATVEAVDLPARLVSLRGPNGPATISVGPQVSNLENVRVGDEVVVSYYEAIAAILRKNRYNHPACSRVTKSAGSSTAVSNSIQLCGTGLNTALFLQIGAGGWEESRMRTLSFPGPWTWG